ncbi:MAG: putative peptidoglycan glycosyltransferase FtsW [Caldilineaceae bacterium]
MATQAMTTVTKRRTEDSGFYDWGLLTIVMILVGFGMVMVFSSSFAKGLDGYEDPFFYVARQTLWCFLGLATMIIISRIPYRIWERWSVILMAVALFALMLVVIFGSEEFAAKRTYFDGSVQPSEPAKIIIIMYISAWLTSKGERIRDVRVGLLPFSVLMGAIAVLIVAQPNISTAILIVATASIMFFIAGAELKQLLVIGAGAAATFWLVIKYSAYANGRVQRYLESLWDPMQSNEYQVQQAVEALVRGGITGRGIGNGHAQLPGYLPVSWSDNIFAVIGEEMGIIGALVIILLFAMLAYMGLRTALRAPDTFGMLLATGITASHTLQALLNMAVIVAAAPPTGVTLPFISYGGSSLVTALAAVGILLNISRYAGEGKAPAALGNRTYARFDLGWRNRGARLSGTGSRRAAGKPSTTSRTRTSRPTRTASRRATR